MTTCRCAVSDPSLNDAWMTPSSRYTESPGPSVVDSCSMNWVICPCLTMIISSCPGCRWKSWPPPGSSVTSMTTRCFDPLSGTSRHPITPQSNCSCRTSVCLTKLLIVVSSLDGYRLEAAHVLCHRDLGRQTLHRGRAEEADDSLGVRQDVRRVVGLCDRPAVAQHENLRIDALRGVVHPLHELHRLVERLRGLRADRTAGRQSHVRHEHVGARLRHRRRLVIVEDVGRRQKIAFVREPDHV